MRPSCQRPRAAAIAAHWSKRPATDGRPAGALDSGGERYVFEQRPGGEPAGGHEDVAADEDALIPVPRRVARVRRLMPRSIHGTSGCTARSRAGTRSGSSRRARRRPAHVRSPPPPRGRERCRHVRTRARRPWPAARPRSAGTPAREGRRSAPRRGGELARAVAEPPSTTMTSWGREGIAPERRAVEGAARPRSRPAPRRSIAFRSLALARSTGDSGGRGAVARNPKAERGAVGRSGLGPICPRAARPGACRSRAPARHRRSSARSRHPPAGRVGNVFQHVRRNAYSLICHASLQFAVLDPRADADHAPRRKLDRVLDQVQVDPVDLVRIAASRAACLPLRRAQPRARRPRASDARFRSRCPGAPPQTPPGVAARRRPHDGWQKQADA